MELFHQIQEFITQWFMTYTYEPSHVYVGVAIFMILTCFGLPIPEEIAIIAVGLITHIGMNPDLYPPPEGATSHVTLPAALAVTWLSVILGDSLVFLVGRYIGSHPAKREWVQRWIPKERFDRASVWMKRYGFWTAGIFRITPGLRLPGHFACGMLGVPFLKFLAVDGLVATVTIPTQILLLAFYGDAVLHALEAAKEVIVILAFLVLLGLGLYFWLHHRRKLTKSNANPHV